MRPSHVAAMAEVAMVEVAMAEVAMPGVAMPGVATAEADMPVVTPALHITAAIRGADIT
jgi:hypothetical protein